MTQQVLEARQTLWRPRSQFNHVSTQRWIRLVGSMLWLLLYLSLCRRLWNSGVTALFSGRDMASTTLILACIGLGVPLLLAWRTTSEAWLARLRASRQKTDWAPRTIAEAHQLSPGDFEEYVAQRIFARQGYQVHNTPDVKDGGVDIAVTDHHGHLIIIQCKRYRNTVGSATVRELYGTMIHEGAAHAFLVTSGRISKDARDWAKDKPIFLMDGEHLARLAHAQPGTLRKQFIL